MIVKYIDVFLLLFLYHRWPAADDTQFQSVSMQFGCDALQSIVYTRALATRFIVISCVWNACVDIGRRYSVLFLLNTDRLIAGAQYDFLHCDRHVQGVAPNVTSTNSVLFHFPFIGVRKKDVVAFLFAGESFRVIIIRYELWVFLCYHFCIANLFERIKFAMR